MPIESFDPFASIEKNPTDLRVDFEHLGVHHHRFVRSMSRSEAIRVVMLACGICPTKRRQIDRVRISLRSDARWNPTNPKPVW